jgi:hypothetical protein
LVWYTLAGGDSADVALAIAVDEIGRVTIAGTTASNNIIAPNDTTGMEFTGARDGFAIQYSQDGALLWDKYIGGGGSESITALTTYGETIVYYAGLTNSGDQFIYDSEMGFGGEMFQTE